MPGDNAQVEADCPAAEMLFCREQIARRHPKNFSEKLNLLVRNRAALGFDVREDIACHVAAEELQLPDEVVLRPSPLIAELGHITANDIVVAGHALFRAS